MNRTKALILSLLLGVATMLPLKATAMQPITLSMPESVISATMQSVLPLQLNTRASALKGKITIVDISNLNIFNGGLSARIRLSGKNMAISTNIGGKVLNLNVGSIDIDVTTDATLRFDRPKQTLYIRPTVRQARTSKDGQVDQMGNSLVALLNGQEFPVALQQLQPIVSQTGNKQVVIKTHIYDVVSRNHILELQLIPTVSTTPYKNRS